MVYFNKKAILKQFPWLTAGDKPLIDPKTVDKMTVARISPELMKVTPAYDFWSAGGYQTTSSDRYFLLDKDGQLLKEVRQKKIEQTCSGQNFWQEEGEEVGEAIAELDDPSSCTFIVYHHFEVDEMGRTELVVVYKPPKNFTISQWIEEQMQRAICTLAQQLNAIDAEG